MDCAGLIIVGLGVTVTFGLLGYMVFSSIKENMRQKKMKKESKEAEARSKIIQDHEKQQRDAKFKREETEKNKFFTGSLVEGARSRDMLGLARAFYLYDNGPSYDIREGSTLHEALKRIIEKEVLNFRIQLENDLKNKTKKKAGKK